jgi:hypothetical protein
MQQGKRAGSPGARCSAGSSSHVALPLMDAKGNRPGNETTEGASRWDRMPGAKCSSPPRAASAADDNTHISASDLRRRGWTNAVIRRFLPTPDALRPNPHHMFGAPARCYAIERVDALEQLPDLALAKQQSHVRSVRSAAASARAQEQMLASAAACCITVRCVPADDRLFLSALRHFVEWAGAPEDPFGLPYTPPGPPWRTRDWIEARYVMRALLSVDLPAGLVFGAPGTVAAGRIVFARALAAVAEVYPHLADECEAIFGEWQGRASLPT